MWNKDIFNVTGIIIVIFIVFVLYFVHPKTSGVWFRRTSTWCKIKNYSLHTIYLDIYILTLYYTHAQTHSHKSCVRQCVCLCTDTFFFFGWMGKSNLICVSWYADCGCNNLINFKHNLMLLLERLCFENLFVVKNKIYEWFSIK